jgi:hypothetical protein
LRLHLPMCWQLHLQSQQSSWHLQLRSYLHPQLQIHQSSWHLLVLPLCLRLQLRMC